MQSSMKINHKLTLFLIYFISCFSHSGSAESRHQLLEWQFAEGDFENAPSETFDDSLWRTVRLPHDWSIEHVPNASASSDHGGGFFPTGTGWYRCSFQAPESWRDQLVSVLFEGSYRQTEVWINGHSVATNENGYLPFRAQLNRYLKYGEKNILAVRVDNSRQPNSRWYTGSGLYRPVSLEVRQPIHILPDSLFVHTAYLYPRTATLEANMAILNETSEAASVTVDLHIIDPDGFPVIMHREDVESAVAESAAVSVNLPVGNPRLWSPESPERYRCVARVFHDGALADRVEIEFGIRTIEFDSEEGFLLNGTAYLLKGANVHHDNGPLGAKAFRDAEWRKVRLLKEAGFNALRTAHNPPSRYFLEACDAMGIFVIAEAFDGWKSAKLKADYSVDFTTHWRDDLRCFIQRDRNHPSIILWSIGNELYERGKRSTVGIAEEMAAIIRELDSSRAVTIGLNGLGETRPWADLDPLFATVDVAGYNYELSAQQAADRERVPSRIVYASESFHNEVFENWQLMQQYPNIIGEFLWSGLDYLGESGIGRIFGPEETVFAHWEDNHFPFHGALCGMLDLIGQPRGHARYRQLVWGEGPDLTLAVVPPVPGGGQWQTSKWAPPPLETHWTWPGHEGQAITVEVYSRHPIVRIFCNNTLLGEQNLGADAANKAIFEVSYEPGTLHVQGLVGETVVEEVSLQTAGPPRRILLKCDKSSMRPNDMDLIFVEVQIVDALGRVCPHAELPVNYTLEGPGEIIAIGSGDLASQENYLANPRSTHQGRALLVIRAGDQKGSILLTASSPDLVDAALGIKATYAE
jgi:beta-galactosidase